MRILVKKERDPALVRELLEIWESSVRETHLFLSDGEIEKIKEYVPQALISVPVLLVAEDETGALMGFMGIAEKRLEMLFLSNTAWSTMVSMN